MATLKGWIESVFKKEGAWRTWAIVAASVLLALFVLWVLQVVLGWDIGGFVNGMVQ